MYEGRKYKNEKTFLPIKSFAVSDDPFHSLPFRLCAIGYNKQQLQVQSTSTLFYEVIIGSHGKGVVRIQGGESFVLHPEQAVIIKPGSKLEFQAVDEGWESAVLRFACRPSVSDAISYTSAKTTSFLLLEENDGAHGAIMAAGRRR